MSKDQEKALLKSMIEIHCKGKHNKQELCPNCLSLLIYSEQRLDRCPMSEKRTTCQQCTIHCYSPEMKSRIIEVMRYSGKRMLLHHPVAAIKHLLQLLK